jgi:DmsE family decaheme c-type cytochrome
MIIVAVMPLLLPLPVSGNQTPPGAQFVGSAACADCHEETVTAFKQTVHGLAFSDDDARGAVTCESCHGPGSAHVEEMDPALIGNPARDDQFRDGPLCLNCHNTAVFDDWSTSHHNTADVNCSACHEVHTDPHESGVSSSPELCYGCHADVRAASFMPSHHPVREGKLSCLDCHGVHGGGGKMTQNATGRELCFSCHAEIEGPFVFEHAPVNEDCLICHTPHGAVADNLLTLAEPALCLNCHAMHFHASVPGWDGDFTVNVQPDRTGTSTPDAWKKGMLTKCTQCHTEIHGSDLPSQAISTSGKSLTR